ncbi:MAG: S8 family serine peptidase [Gemmatimonadota bacterium]
MGLRRSAVAVAVASTLLVSAFVTGASGQSGKQPNPRPGNAKDVSIVDPATRFVPGEVLVRFRAGVSGSARDAALGTVNARFARETLLPGLVLARLEPGRSVPGAVAALSRRSDVLYAEPNLILRATATPNDPRFESGELWGLHNTGQSSGTPDADIDAPEAWNTTVGSSGVVVAVVDTGIAYDHPDLAPNIWANPGEVPGDSVDNDGNGKVDDHRGWDFIGNDNDPRDLNAHGTHVAGTIGAKGNNSTGVTGVNWNVQLMPVRVLDADGMGTLESVANGFTYAAQEGAKVVNASLGVEGGPEPASTKAAIDAAPSTLFVVAAGNGGDDGIGDNNESVPHWPCNHASANLVCVAATTRTDARSGFSNFGATSVDLGAPGSEIVSTWLGYTSKLSDGFESVTGWVPGVGPEPPFATTCPGPAPANTWARTGEAADTGAVSAADSPGGNYVDCQNNWFRAPVPVSFAGSVGCNVAYRLRLETEPNFDYFVVDASTDLTFVQAEEVAAWTGTTGGTWFSFVEDLSALDGQPNVWVRFGLESDDLFSNFNGAHVDNVDIRCIGTNYTADSYESIQGTSMATPHVAGVAALAWAKNSSVSVATVKSALLNGGDSIPALSGITVSGRRLNADGTLALIPASATPELVVLKGGNGGGTITGTGITCGSDCSESYAPGANVVLTATPLYASTLTGWSNCDSPSGNTCTMTMSSSKVVTATFTTTPTFADVPPSHPFYPFIEQLVDLGITSGCGTNGSGQPLYCPNAPVQRQQMAVFLMKATGQTALDSPTPTFADVPSSSPFYGWVERLNEQGITGGCSASPPLFCPTDPVTRASMAVFVVKAKGLAPFDNPTPTFADVPLGAFAYSYIERMYEQDITGGCLTDPLRYCPDAEVTRGQMAVFLIRAFEGS